MRGNRRMMSRTKPINKAMETRKERMGKKEKWCRLIRSKSNTGESQNEPNREDKQTVAEKLNQIKKDRSRKKKMHKKKNKVVFKNAISQIKSRKRKDKQDTTGAKDTEEGEKKSRIKNLFIRVKELNCEQVLIKLPDLLITLQKRLNGMKK